MGPAHLAIGLAAKPVAPKAPLWALLVASEALDLLSAGFIPAGIEKVATRQVSLDQGIQVLVPGSIPWSHGLFMSLFWSIFFGAVAYMVTRNRNTNTVIGLVTFSHWALDFIVHPPDMPLLFAGSPEVGLGLWTSGPGFVASILLELALLAGGIAIYWVTRRKIIHT